MLQAFQGVIEFQIKLFAASLENAIVGVVALNFLIAYTLLTAGSQRRPMRHELAVVAFLLVVAVWIALQLMEKAQLAMAGGM